MLKKIWKDETGGQLAEYAIVGSVMLVAAAIFLPGVAAAIQAAFNAIVTALTP